MSRPPVHAAAVLHELTHLLGARYGSSEICHFLYALVKMHRPTTVVELGAGLGISTWWMGLALAELGAGRLWTVDDFSHYPDFRAGQLPALRPELERLGIALPEEPSGLDYFAALGERLGLSDRVEVVPTRIDLSAPHHFELYPFADRPIDLLFSDFDSSPGALLQQLIHLLPRMADCFSLFIDSVPAVPTSYYMLGDVVEMLNAGRIPKAVADFLTPAERDRVLGRRYTLVHLTYNPTGSQCGTSWIKAEPHDVFPYPRVPFRIPGR